MKKESWYRVQFIWENWSDYKDSFLVFKNDEVLLRFVRYKRQKPKTLICLKIYLIDKYYAMKLGSTCDDLYILWY